MFESIKNILKNAKEKMSSNFSHSESPIYSERRESGRNFVALMPSKFTLLAVGVAIGSAYWVYSHPLMQSIDHGSVGIRTNQYSGKTELMSEGKAWVISGVHQLREFNLHDQIYRPTQGRSANSSGSFQSVEGLSLGVDLTVRYAISPNTLLEKANHLPEDLDSQLIEPTVQSVIYKTFTAYTVREIFSTKRQEIQQKIEAELKPKLAADGILLRSVMIGQIDLPADYKRGLENLLAQELESEKMKYTLELKEKQVKQTALEAEADRVRSETEAKADKVKRELEAEASANEQIIAAKAQEEAMKHVLPFKQKQIEQRSLEAEADKISRVKQSEASAQARQIEAEGEANSRRKLADAEAYRQSEMGKVNTAQMEREGELLDKHPLLIQKTMADKLSDKVSVIIAPSDKGSFIGNGLLGNAVANK